MEVEFWCHSVECCSCGERSLLTAASRAQAGFAAPASRPTTTGPTALRSQERTHELHLRSKES